MCVRFCVYVSFVRLYSVYDCGRCTRHVHTASDQLLSLTCVSFSACIIHTGQVSAVLNLVGPTLILAMRT